METKEITKQIKKELKVLDNKNKYYVKMWYPQIRIGYTDGLTVEEVKKIVEENITDKMNFHIERYMSKETQMKIRKELGFEDDSVYMCEKTNGINNSLIVQNKFDEMKF